MPIARCGRSQTLVWNRTPKRAEELVANYRLQEDASALNSIGVTDDLEAAVSGADIVTRITASSEPVIFGDWVREGTHVDLVGAFSPDSRESDDALVQKARIFVDTRTGALAEAGDLIIPMNKGLITEDDVAADLFDLTQGERDGRRFYEQITLFKNCGSAIEDLVAARSLPADLSGGGEGDDPTSEICALRHSCRKSLAGGSAV